MRGFSSSGFGGFFGKADIYTRERKKNKRILWIVKAEREVFKGRERKHEKDQWRFSHRKEVFPGMFTVDPSLIPIILLMYEFSLDFESRFDARG